MYDAILFDLDGTLIDTESIALVTGLGATVEKNTRSPARTFRRSTRVPSAYCSAAVRGAGTECCASCLLYTSPSPRD